jgi:putative addiction module killer protein
MPALAGTELLNMKESTHSHRSIVQGAAYERWFDRLPDSRAKARVLASVRRLSLGNFGNAKSLGKGLHELRVDYGPGYRIYFATYGERLLLLAYGGDKSRQKSDIARARELAAAWEPEDGA